MTLAGGVAKVIPGSVTVGGTAYTVQPQLVLIPDAADPTEGNLVPQLKDPSGKLDSDLASDHPLWLRSTDDVDARGVLQQVRQYLRALRNTYAGYSVIFLDIFCVSQAESGGLLSVAPWLLSGSWPSRCRGSIPV